MSQNGDAGPIFEKSVKRMSILTLALLSIVLVALTLPMLRTKTVYDVEQFLPQGDETLTVAQKVREKYQLGENPALAVIIERGAGQDWIHPDAAKTLRAVGETLATEKGVGGVYSFANRPGAEMNARQIQAGLLTEIVPPADWARRFRADPLMTPLFLSPDQKSALLYLELTTTDILQMKAIFARINEELPKNFPGARVQIGGIPALQTSYQTLLENDLFRFVGFSFLATFCLIFAMFRGLSPVVVSLVSVASANIAVLGSLALFGIDLTVLTVTVPILVTVTVLAQVVHTFFRLNERSREPGFKKHLRVQRDLLFPNFLANLTTAVGFVTLAPSEIPMIAQYGAVVAGTIMVSWVFTTLLLPALTLHFKPPVPRSWTRFRARFTLFVMKHHRAVALSVASLSVVFAAGALGLNWETRIFDDLPEGHVSRATTEHIDRDFGGVIPLNVELTAKDSQFWKEPRNLVRLDDRIQAFRELTGVGQVVSVVDFLKAFGEGDRFPRTSAAVSELMFLYTLSGPSPLRAYVSPDGRSLRLQMKIRDIPGPQMENLVRQIDRDLSTDFPDTKVAATGMANHLHRINNRVSGELIFGFWQAMFVIFLILIPVFRSVRWALVACLPNLVAPAVLLGTMALSQAPIKPPLALIFSISLGLAFNNTCYVFDRLRVLHQRGRKTRLLEHVFQKEFVNCLHSTLVVIAGFAVFLFAEFSVNRTFGAFMLISIAAGVIGDLVFLPALLAWKPALLGLPARAPNGVKSPAPSLTKYPAAPETGTTDAKPSPQPVRRPAMPSDLNRAASFVFFALALGALAPAPSAYAGPNDGPAQLKARFQKAMKQFESRDESAKVKLTIVETDGSKLVREMDIQRTGAKKEQRMLARITAPSDLKGTSLLSIVTPEDENQWVYLPSSKQVRKVVASESSDSGVLGSELRYEDFDPSVVRETAVTFLKSVEQNGKTYDILEAALPVGKSPYDKVQVWILTGKELPTQMDYFAGGQKTKSIQFSGYKKVGKVVRPTKLAIRNLKNKRGTDIELTNLKINKGLPPQKLSVDSLAKAW